MGARAVAFGGEMSQNWVDVTTYSRDDKARKPTAFALQVGEYFRLVVTCSHRDYRGQWVAHFHPVFQCRKLHVSTEDEAKAAAEKLAKEIINDAAEWARGRWVE